MYARLPSLLVVTAISCGTLAGAPNTGYDLPYVARSRSYTINDRYSGTDFYTEWSFFTSPDPTNGNVNYVSLEQAQKLKMTYVNSDNAIVFAVDPTDSVLPGQNRNSIRISSKKVYNGGLFIFDVAAMPVGCGTWPSIWTYGPNWPAAGEIDIVEGINDQPYNQMTLHSGTSHACTISDNTSQFTGKVLGTNCYSTATRDAGCGISDRDPTSFGHGFNDAGGGVFVLLWDASAGMSIWHFARAHVPADITNGAPTPTNWGTPHGFWSAQTRCPGTCEDMVANATNFVDAKWVINSIAVYS